MELQPQSGRTLEPKQSSGVRQSVSVWHAGDRSRKVGSAKLRWMVEYKVGGEPQKETGAIDEFSIV